MKTTIDTYCVCRKYLEDNAAVVGPILASKLLGWVRARKGPLLATACELLPSDALHVTDLRRVLMQVEAFFKKNASLEFDIDTEAVALEGFLESERICKETNERLDSEACSQYENELNSMRRFISKVLGPYRPFLDSLPGRIRITSGATATRPRSKSKPYLKVSKVLESTVGASYYLQALSDYYGYGKLKFRYTLRNRVVTVPKNWKTDRTIACEPTGNLPLQLAFDGYMKSRLKKFNIDLSDQTVNQRLAREGSIDGSLATIDLSMASDLLAANAVALLVREDWLQFLTAIRSPGYKYSEEIQGEYHKFSSMGNGATFALETLMFSAACYAVGSKRFSVYGDDIIVESDLYEKTVNLLEFIGFKVNEAKSFSKGSYRESCGYHYDSGILITPFYLRSVGRSKAELSHNVNGLAHIAKVDGALWNYLKTIVVEGKLHFVPFNESSMSGVWVDTHTAYQNKLLHAKSWIIKFKGYKPKSSKPEIAADTRSLFLWYLSAKVVDPPYLHRQSLHDFAVKSKQREASDTRRSRVSASTDVKYVRKWTIYNPVDRRYTPTTLYAWSDFISRES